MIHNNNVKHLQPTMVKSSVIPKVNKTIEKKPIRIIRKKTTTTNNNNSIVVDQNIIHNNTIVTNHDNNTNVRNDMLLSRFTALPDHVFDEIYKSQNPVNNNLFQKLTVAKNLFLIDLESYEHFKRKLLLPNGEEEVAKLNVLNDKRVNMNAKTVGTCSICMEDIDHCLKCPQQKHTFCKNCFNIYVASNCFKDTSQAVGDGINLKNIIKRKGKIYCPDPTCSSNCTSVTNGMAIKPFMDSEIIEHCNNDVVLDYMNTITYAKVQNETMTKVQDFMQSVSDKLPQFDRENRRQSLKNACAGARMCRKCSYGPMEKSHCDDLQAHSHQYQNACPRCGDHAVNWRDLPEWDGRLPEETKIGGEDNNLTNNKDGTSGNDEMQVHVSVEAGTDFFLHIKYPIEGYLLIRPSLGDRIIPVLISHKKCHCWQILRPKSYKVHQVEASYVFKSVAAKGNMCDSLVGTITDNIFFVSGTGTVKIKKIEETPHLGSWTGCGGNPAGTSHGRTYGNCGSKCKDCGSNTHWNCCSSTDQSSTTCLLGVTKLQALKNAKLCRQGKGNKANYQLAFGFAPKKTRKNSKIKIKTFTNGTIVDATSNGSSNDGSSNSSSSSSSSSSKKTTAVKKKARSIAFRRKTTTSTTTKKTLTSKKAPPVIHDLSAFPLGASSDSFPPNNGCSFNEVDFRPRIQCWVKANVIGSADSVYQDTLKRWGEVSTRTTTNGTSGSSAITVLSSKIAHASKVYHFPQSEALKILNKKTKAKVIDKAVAYSRENSKVVVKGYNAFIAAERSEETRFAIIDKDVKLFEELQRKKRARNNSAFSSSSSSSLSVPKYSARAKLNSAKHLIDWKNDMIYSTTGHVFTIIKNEAFTVDTIEIIGTKGNNGRHEEIARGSTTRTIKLGKTWDEFVTNASQSLGFDVKSGHIMKQVKQTRMAHIHMGIVRNRYTVSGLLDKNTFQLQKKHITGTDVLLCHEMTIEEKMKKQMELRIQQTQRRVQQAAPRAAAHVPPPIGRAREYNFVNIGRPRAVGYAFRTAYAPLESDDGTVIRACNNSVISATFMGLHAYAALHNIDTSKPKPLPLKTAKDAKGNEVINLIDDDDDDNNNVEDKRNDANKNKSISTGSDSNNSTTKATSGSDSGSSANVGKSNKQKEVALAINNFETAHRRKKRRRTSETTIDTTSLTSPPVRSDSGSLRSAVARARVALSAMRNRGRESQMEENFRAERNTLRAELRLSSNLYAQARTLRESLEFDGGRERLRAEVQMRTARSRYREAQLAVTQMELNHQRRRRAQPTTVTRPTSREEHERNSHGLRIIADLTQRLLSRTREKTSESNTSSTGGRLNTKRAVRPFLPY